MNETVTRYLEQQLEAGVKTLYMPDGMAVSLSVNNRDKREQGKVAKKAVEPKKTAYRAIQSPLACIKADPYSGNGEIKSRLLSMLYEKNSRCIECGLGENREKFIFGEGNTSARIMFICERPEIADTVNGRLLSAEARTLVEKIIENGMGLSIKDVYISSLLKCYSSVNKNPSPEDYSRCFKYIIQQIEIIMPEFICCFGMAPGIMLTALPETTTMKALRQKLHMVGLFKLLVTYSPFRMIDHPETKREVWEDIQLLMRAMKIKGK